MLELILKEKICIFIRYLESNLLFNDGVFYKLVA